MPSVTDPETRQGLNPLALTPPACILFSVGPMRRVPEATEIQHQTRSR